MKLSDLIPGYHTVELRSGDFYLVMMDKNKNLCFSRHGGWTDSRYSENFKHNADNYKSYNIIAVYEPESAVMYNSLDSRLKKQHLSLVYRVEEEIELTVDQISELLGYKVKVVGDKQ